MARGCIKHQEKYVHMRRQAGRQVYYHITESWRISLREQEKHYDHSQHRQAVLASIRESAIMDSFTQQKRYMHRKEQTPKT